VRPAVFLDRDGVLTEEKGYLHSGDRLHIFPYAAECVRRFHELGYYAIVVTNQSAVARGYLSEDALLEMNRELIERTGVDAVYYCPHHEQGTVPEYRLACQCRKPQTGLIERARADFDIDMSRSLMVGDRAGDILTGERAGLRTILLESGYGSARLERPVKPDYILNDLRDAAGLCGRLSGKDTEGLI